MWSLITVTVLVGSRLRFLFKLASYGLQGYLRQEVALRSQRL